MSASVRTDSTPLLRPAEVARILDVTPRTVRRYSEAGRLPRILLSQRCVRYRASDVAALVDPYNGEDPAGNRAFAKERDDAAHRTG